MNAGLRLPHDAWILVGDGRKALFLRNEGDEVFANLRVERVLQAEENPPTHAQGTDRPGRVAIGTHRSAVEGTDWHELAEHRFASDITAALGALHDAKRLKSLVVVAPPHTLADIRQSLPDRLQKTVAAEIAKDLTKMPVYDIERLLMAS